jgi:hypothetical protein
MSNTLPPKFPDDLPFFYLLHQKRLAFSFPRRAYFQAPVGVNERREKKRKAENRKEKPSLRDGV